MRVVNVSYVATRGQSPQQIPLNNHGTLSSWARNLPQNLSQRNSLGKRRLPNDPNWPARYSPSASRWIECTDTSHSSPRAMLAFGWFFFFLNTGKEKENKKRTKKRKHITYSALPCCFQKPSHPQEPLFLNTWKFSMFGHSSFAAKRGSIFCFLWSLLFLSPAFSWSPFLCPGLFSTFSEGKLMNSPSLLQQLSPCRLGLPVYCLALFQVQGIRRWTKHIHSLPSWSLYSIVVAKDNKQIRWEVLKGQSKSKEEKDGEMQA